jgi:ATP-binding cassette subfamily C (CFTR/MRP) protein 1
MLPPSFSIFQTHIYRNYISSASTIGVVTFLIAIFAAQGSSLVGNLVLRRWGERNLSEHKTAQIGVFLFYYGLAGISASGAFLLFLPSGLRRRRA